MFQILTLKNAFINKYTPNGENVTKKFKVCRNTQNGVENLYILYNAAERQ